VYHFEKSIFATGLTGAVPNHFFLIEMNPEKY
ncbi:uncharacterized protein METZ01_LOCUS204592, partial [marine metagenome]